MNITRHLTCVFSVRVETVACVCVCVCVLQQVSQCMNKEIKHVILISVGRNEPHEAFVWRSSGGDGVRLSGRLRERAGEDEPLPDLNKISTSLTELKARRGRSFCRK